MAEISVVIHGKTYGIACDDGQERRVMDLSKYVDMRLREIASTGAATTEPHLLVLTALMLADEIFDTRAAVSAPAQPPVHEGLSPEDEKMIVDAITHLTSKIDSMTEKLVKA